jgi:hypothetical protein
LVETGDETSISFTPSIWFRSILRTRRPFRHPFHFRQMFQFLSQPFRSG